MVPYIQCTAGVSLRLIDWFVTSYCKRNDVVVKGTDNALVNVHLSYRQQLKSYSTFARVTWRGARAPAGRRRRSCPTPSLRGVLEGTAWGWGPVGTSCAGGWVGWVGYIARI
jgi:hypothetical protein